MTAHFVIPVLGCELHSLCIWAAIKMVLYFSGHHNIAKLARGDKVVQRAEKAE